MLDSDLEWLRFQMMLTRKVKRGEGVSVCSDDHVRDLVHYALLGQILPTMLTVG